MVGFGKVVNDKEKIEGVNRARVLTSKTNNKEYIMVYGFTKEDILALSKKIPKKVDLDIITTNVATDCFGFDPILAFINTKKLTDKQMKDVNDSYVEVIHNPRIQFIGTDKRFEWKGKFYKDEKEYKKKVEYAILSAISENKKSKAFSTQLSNALLVFKRIVDEPYISAKDLNNYMYQKAGISPRTVKRLIRSLNISGESIHYDSKKKGWKVWNNMSLLMANLFGMGFEAMIDGVKKGEK